MAGASLEARRRATELDESRAARYGELQSALPTVSRRKAEPGPWLLLFAEPLQREGLLRWLEDDPAGYRVTADPAQEGLSPRLLIWSITSPPPAERLEAEARQLLDRWQPAPLLLLIPGGHNYPQRLLLSLPVQGLLEQPEPNLLRQSVATLLSGGRVVEIAPASGPPPPVGRPPLGLGEWLLVSGLEQIDTELRVCAALLDPLPANPLAQLLLEGRLRELQAARSLLLWLWGPLQMAWSPGGQPWKPGATVDGSRRPTRRELRGSPGTTGGAGAGRLVLRSEAAPGQGGVSLTLRQRTADGIWLALRERLSQAASVGPDNRSGELLAFDALHPDRRRDLLQALLEQFELLRRRLQPQELGGDALIQTWNELQPELRRQALRRMAGSYVQLPSEGKLRPVADTLVGSGDFTVIDPEIPDPMAMLTTLLQARPLLVEGRLLGPDEPQAVLYLEMLLANWLVRSAELISAEVLAACAEWPELRRYLLRPDLLATRNLERLRNQLNNQQRWSSWITRPVQLYQSQRPLFRLEGGAIDTITLTEPRDRELRQLPWLQQLVTLALEARDALAPQVQSLIRGFGDLVVVVLTQVVGRAIGLVGRGIAQGMGRSLGRAERS